METSSQWKKPSEIMKIHRRRKSVSQKRITTVDDSRTTVIYKSPSKSMKRRNPFSVSEHVENPSKRQHLDKLENGIDVSPLFNVLSKTEDKTDKHSEFEHFHSRQATTGVIHDAENGHHTTDKRSPSASSYHQEQKSSTQGEDQVKTGKFPYVPIDWSIKTKMRIISTKPLQWCTQLKSTEEAHGISGFVQDNQMEIDSTVDQKRVFQSCCMYWEHPNIPWIRLFPRIIDDSKLSTNTSYFLQDDIQKTLQADWEQSFTSVYHQLRSRLCPYFYLCTHQFTVMFYNQSSLLSDLVAMVTPTTRGFREALENEGITFKLPVGNKLTSPGQSPVSGKENDQPYENSEQNDVDKRREDIEEDEDTDLLDTDDAASGWLESIGLDKKAFPSLDPKKVKMQREGFRVIDNRPESLVFVQGSDVQALFNFLLNCRTCTATSGPQAGVPPTILSPAPFKGATLKSHKVKHSTVKQSDREGHISHANILEVTGPILTSHSQALTSLFHHTQSSNFSFVYSNHESTTPFNILPKLLKGNSSEISKADSRHGSDKCESNQENFSTTQLQLSNIANRFYKHVEISDRLSNVKEVVSSTDGFSWDT